MYDNKINTFKEIVVPMCCEVGGKSLFDKVVRMESVECVWSTKLLALEL